MRRTLGLLRADATNLVRDPVLLFVCCIPVLLGVLLRVAVPQVAAWAAPAVDVRPYFPLVASFALLIPAVSFGWVIGFMLLDERDEDVLSAIAVSPMGREGFLGWRLALPVTLSVPAACVVLALSGLAPVRLVALLPVAALAALGAPLFALFLAGFAANKVEGMALAKVGGLALLAPLALLVEGPWQLLAGVLPSYWVARAFLAEGAEVWWSLAVGGAVHVAVLALLLRRFRARAG